MSQTTTTLRNLVDASAAEGAPSRHYEDSTRLRLRSGTGTTNYAYIHFSRSFPLGSTILSAELTVYGYGSWASATRNMVLKRITEKWAQAHLTWNNKPAVTATGAVTVTKTGARSDGDAWTFDIKTLVQDISDGTANHGFRLELDDATLRKLYSANAHQHKPVLTVTYTTAPDKPSDLTPDGGQQVSVSHPVLKTKFVDHAGNTELDAIQVQIDAADDFSAPDFDSGAVVTELAELDLSTTAYAGLAAGATTYWRVRLRDGSGQWSPWSDSAQFGRTDKGTLTITSPAAAPGNVVEDRTPTITWSTSVGVTQASYRVWILDSSGEELYDSGRIPGTVQSHEVAKGVIVDTSQTYTVRVHVRDDVDRVTTGTDTAWYSASRDFTVDPTPGTTTAVSGLTLTSLEPLPGVQLDWTRGAAPDTYAIYRTDEDGETTLVDAHIDPSDVLVSGTSYQYKDKGVDPRRTFTWEVVAVENGVESTSNPTVSAFIAPTGIWLADEENNLYVPILGADEGTWEMSEDSEVFTPLGAQAPVVITQSLRGFGGTITGEIMDFNNVSVQTYEKRLLKMRAKPGRTYTLTLSDRTIPVVVRNLVIAPTPGPEITKEVSFDFVQVAGFDWKAHL